MSTLYTVLACVGLLVMSNASAYKVTTHARVTQHTYTESGLHVDSQLPVLMGLDKYNPVDPFGETYLDIDKNNNIVAVRRANDFSKLNNRFPSSFVENGLTLTIQGWLMRGSIREDDVCLTPLLTSHCDGPLFEARIKHHFFDPINNRPLTNKALSILGDPSEKATDWATGSVDTFTDPDTINQLSNNHFSLIDAREAMWRALTGKDTVDGSLDIRPSDFGGTDDELRKAYWATVFRSLGDVLHIVQDLSQPQHTRDEIHPVNGSIGINVYEEYTNKRASAADGNSKANFDCFGGGKQSIPVLFYTGYPKVIFNKYSEYFSTNPGDEDETEVLNGKGIADYSNRGFFTAGNNMGSPGTNIGNSSYPYPSTNPADYQVTDVIRKNLCIPNSTQFVAERLYSATVTDKRDPAYDAFKPLTASGMWRVDLNDGEGGFIDVGGFSLTESNYRAMSDLLIPRAVAYGAGLLDYFFRGRLAVSLPPEGIYGIIDHTADHAVINNVPRKGQSGDGDVFGFEKIILNVSNITPAIDDGQPQPHAQDIGAGTFRAVAHYRLNPCYTTDLSGEADIVVCNTNLITDSANIERTATSEAVAVTSFNNSSTNRIEFDFSAEPIPVNAADLKIQVVYYGELGTEAQAIAVGMKNISEPSYYLTWNASDYFSLDGMIYKTDDQVFLDLAQSEGISPAQYTAYSTGPGTLTVGNAAGVAQTPAFNPGGYIRIAYLADYDPISLVSYIAPISGASFLFQPRRVSIDENDVLTFHVIGSVGDNTKRIYGNSIFNMTHQQYPAGSQYGSFTNISNFPVPEKKQVTVCFPPATCP